MIRGRAMPHPHIARKRWLATTLASSAIMAGASFSAAASAAFDDVLTDLGDWGLAMAEHAGGPADSFEDIEPVLAGSFWYEGLAYEPPFTISTEPQATARLARSCERKYGARGVVRRGRTRFLACLAISSFESANGDNGFDWSEARLGKLPPPFRRYRAKLGKLAKDHWLVVSHFRDAGKRVDLWNLYVVELTQDRLLAGVLVGRERLARSSRSSDEPK